MAKDRLGDFVKKTKEKNNVASVQIEAESEPLIGGGNLRQVLDRAGVIRQWIETIENNVLTLREYIRKLDDLNANKKDLNEKIESLFRNNTSISQQIQGKLKELELELQQEANSNSTEQRIKSIQFNTLKTCYIKAFQCNADELEAFRNLKKSQLDAQLRAKGVKLTEEELNNFLEDGTDIQVFTENILAETAEAKRILQDLEDRHQQLLKIESMLMEIRALFLQMALLVDNQGEMIDRVEYQVQLAQDSVEQGRADLKNGETKRRKYLKRKIILILVVLVLIAIILALVFK